MQSSSIGLSIIQWGAMLLTLAGIFVFEYDLTAVATIILFYFLYAGLGVSMMFHRYYTHKSFKMNKNLAWVFTWLGILAGRGSPMGWVYVHRDHHANADIDGKDPHRPAGYKWWWVFFPHLMQYGKNMNLHIIRDMITDKKQVHVGKYYNAYLAGWVLLLLLIDPWLAYFGWIVPVAITNVAFNSFHHTGHGHGYQSEKNHKSADSTNTWIHGYFLWGEGWHNNHHSSPHKWKFGNKWWELDPVSWVIGAVKQ